MIKDKSILIKNIYYMLAYAFSSLQQAGFEDLATEKFEDMPSLCAAILSHGLARQLKQGLYRQYQSQKEALSVVRGKIDLPATLRGRLARKLSVTCQFDELSENNQLNQILKTTVTLLLKHPQVEIKYKEALKKAMLYFSHTDTLDPFSIPWSSLRFERHNRSYRLLIGLCQLIIQGMLITTEKGWHRLASFFDEQRMSHLYERFILEYYRREFPSLSVCASQIPWAVDDGVRTMLPVMQSDIMLTHQGKKPKQEVLIIDAKYYTHNTQLHYNQPSVHSSHLYQIFAYVKNLEAKLSDRPHQISGMLLYARTQEALQPNQTYQMSGNKISVRTLDLNCRFPLLAAQLNQIAEEHFSLSSQNGQQN